MNEICDKLQKLEVNDVDKIKLEENIKERCCKIEELKEKMADLSA